MDPRYNQYHQQMDTRYNQYQQQSSRPSYPQVSSAESMHSNFPSSTSVSSLASMSTSPTQTTMHSRSSPILSSAPLPSPTAERQAAGGNYFGQMSGQSSQTFVQPWRQRTNSISEHQQQHHQPQSRQPSVDGHQGQMGQGGGMAETAPFLQGFNLLAEAAKRAEMAVLMRDLGDFEM